MASGHKNLYQMYMANGCQFGFYVTRNSWSDGKYAKVIGIEGVKQGEKLKGSPPYFTQKYPIGHPKAGKVIQPRLVYLEAEWFSEGKYETGSGGTYAWTHVYPQ